jgi:hypothetical protein
MLIIRDMINLTDPSSRFSILLMLLKYILYLLKIKTQSGLTDNYYPAIPLEKRVMLQINCMRQRLYLIIILLQRLSVRCTFYFF